MHYSTSNLPVSLPELGVHSCIAAYVAAKHHLSILQLQKAQRHDDIHWQLLTTEEVTAQGMVLRVPVNQDTLLIYTLGVTTMVLHLSFYGRSSQWQRTSCTSLVTGTYDIFQSWDITVFIHSVTLRTRNHSISRSE